MFCSVEARERERLLGGESTNGIVRVANAGLGHNVLASWSSSREAPKGARSRAGREAANTLSINDLRRQSHHIVYIQLVAT